MFQCNIITYKFRHYFLKLNYVYIFSKGMASSDTDISLSTLGIYYSIYNILLVCINQ